MPDARSELLDLLVNRSYKQGHFTLSSGATSDYYIDCRATTLHAEGARLTGRVVLDIIRLSGWAPDAIGGMTLGADPIVVAVSVLSAQEAQPRSDRRSDSDADANQLRQSRPAPSRKPLDGFLVRKAEKQHGTQQRIEGFSQPGAQVVIVDDVCTTGASTIQAIDAARAAQMDVVGIICLVEREASGRANIEATAGRARFISIYTVHDLRERYRLLNRTAHQ